MVYKLTIGALASSFIFCNNRYSIIILIRLCGFPPFYEENNQELFEKIKVAQFEFPSPYFDDVSELAKDVIRGLLVVDPNKRMTPDQLKDHPWVSGKETPMVGNTPGGITAV